MFRMQYHNESIRGCARCDSALGVHLCLGRTWLTDVNVFDTVDYTPEWIQGL